jgi:hypothetical protein
VKSQPLPDKLTWYVHFLLYDNPAGNVTAVRLTPRGAIQVMADAQGIVELGFLRDMALR